MKFKRLECIVLPKITITLDLTYGKYEIEGVIWDPPNMEGYAWLEFSHYFTVKSKAYKKYYELVKEWS